MSASRFIYIFLLSVLTSFNVTVLTTFIIKPNILTPATPEQTLMRFDQNPGSTKRPGQFKCDPKKPFPQLIRLPYLQNSWHAVASCEDHDPQSVATAILYFYAQWVNEFGDPDMSVFESLNNLIIEWGPQKRKIHAAYSIDGEYLEDVTIIGLASSPRLIWCYFPYGSKLSDSSMVHELVHISLWAQYDLPDADHEGLNYIGWTREHSGFIDTIKRELKLSGL